MFYNPQPYYAAAACNLSTKEVEIMSQQHLMQVRGGAAGVVH
jgi:hypothetical protein